MVYQTQGVCSKEIHIEIEDGIIKDVEFMSGCNGSLKGIAQFAKGRSPEEVIQICSGIRCNNRPTSCPDQLASALRGLAQ